MIRFLSASLLVLLSLTLTFPMAANASWFHKIRDVINSPAGQEVFGSVPTGGMATSGASLLTESEMSNALRQALTIGSENVVARLGVTDGFYKDANVHIPLPGALGKVDKALSAVGMGALTDDLELRFNRAAETATEKAKPLFLNAIKQMTIRDAKDILTGADDAATMFLRRTMGSELALSMQPVVEKAIASCGLGQRYSTVMSQYDQLPFTSNVQTNLNDYVVDKAMDGVFYYVAQEEKAIRESPAKRTTELLRKVFSRV